MAHPAVGQTPFLAKLFREILDEFLPRRVALPGCATGNGLEHVKPGSVDSVLALDINAEFLALAASRHGERLGDSLSLREADLADPEAGAAALAPGDFDLIHAALIFEYVDPVLLLPLLADALAPGGALTALLQLPDPEQDAVSTTPFTDLRRLESVIELVPPDHFAAIARSQGLFRFRLEHRKLPISGKSFELSIWRRA